MPPEDGSIDSWSGASKEEIILLVGVVALVVLLIVVTQAVRGWLKRRREMRIFFSIVDSRHLDEKEEEVVRQLAARAKLPRPSEILTSISTFDSLAEFTLRQAIGDPSREGLRTRMESLYSARAKLFPYEPGRAREHPADSPDRKPEAAPAAPPKVPPPS